jgi:hypothetical protein
MVIAGSLIFSKVTGGSLIFSKVTGGSLIFGGVFSGPGQPGTGASRDAVVRDDQPRLSVGERDHGLPQGDLPPRPDHGGHIGMGRELLEGDRGGREQREIASLGRGECCIRP